MLPYALGIIGALIMLFSWATLGTDDPIPGAELAFIVGLAIAIAGAIIANRRGKQP